MSPIEMTHLLVLEDDERAARLLQESLEHRGYEVMTATSQREAWKGVTKQRPDVVLLDYRLSGDETGLDFYRQLQRGGYGLPAILITGFSDEAVLLEAFRAGVHDFVPKSPGYMDYLIAAIERLVRQVRAEQQLAESEELHRLTLGNVSDTVCITNDEGRFVYVCPNAYHNLGYTAEEVYALETIDRLLGGRLYDEAELRHRREIRNIEHTATDKHGRLRHFLVNVKRVAIRGGTRLYTCRDITDRKCVEQALHQERERCSRIVSTAPTMIITTTPEGIIEFVNPAVTRITGYSSAELLGKNCWDILCPGGNAARVEELHQAAEGTPVRDAEIVLVTKDGRERAISWSSMNEHDAQGNVARIIAVGVDVTEQRKLKEQLRQAQKMEAIGRLAGGIAHDFNNLLTVILGNTALALEIADDQALIDLLSDVTDAAQRAGALTRQLLAFSRRQVLEPKVVDLNELISQVQRLLARLIGEDIALRTRLANGLHWVKVDPGQIEQILLNLAINARDAMPRGGNLTIETANLELETSRSAFKSDVPPGSYVVLAVSDTGAGMAPEVKDRIFEPFFTTKGVGRGTGMGLATVLGIVEQSGGNIAVDSKLHKGTTFQIYLPVFTQDVQPQSPRDEPGGQCLGTGTILLVEDEAAVRRVTSRLLKEQGYRVLEAANGGEALELAERFPGPIHLLLTDVVMPLMSGRELSDRLAAARPELKILYMSGYTDDAVLRHGILDGPVAFLHKPFSRAELARQLQSLLSTR